MNLLTAFALVSFVAAPVPKDAGKPESIEGEWKMTEFVKGGKPRPEQLATVTIKGDKLTISDGEREEVVTITLDPKADPATIDLKVEKGKGREQTIKGIYKIEKGKLSICFGMDGDADRPKEFKSDADTKTGLMVLERVKK